MNLHRDMAQLRTRLGYGLILLLLVAGALGPVIQSLDDDENLGLHAFAEPKIENGSDVKVNAHSSPAFTSMVCTACFANLDRTAQELVKPSEYSFIHAPLAVLFFPLLA